MEVTGLVALKNEDPSDAGVWVVSASRDRHLKVWDGSNGQMQAEKDCGCPLTTLAAVDSPAGQLLLCGLEDGTIALRQFNPNFNLGFELTSSNASGHRTAVRAIIRLQNPVQDKLFFVSGCDSGFMNIWSLALAPLMG